MQNKLYFAIFHSKCKQAKARKVYSDGRIYFDYKMFPKSSVKYFTDALFGVMPKEGFQSSYHEKIVFT